MVVPTRRTSGHASMAVLRARFRAAAPSLDSARAAPLCVSFPLDGGLLKFYDAVLESVTPIRGRQIHASNTAHRLRRIHTIIRRLATRPGQALSLMRSSFRYIDLFTCRNASQQAMRGQVLEELQV